MSRPSWSPVEIDTSRPSAARVYDYYLGGFHNFAADREMARQAIEMWPELPLMMRINRAFLRRAVRFAARQGVTQLLDIGSGIPTVGNSHQIAQQEDAAARVVYVDIDPVAVTHSRAILAEDPATVVLQADLRDPDQILNDESVRDMIDFDRPVAILLVAVLHFIDDEDDPKGLVARLYDAVAPGSILIISHASQDGQRELAETHQRLYARTPTPMTMRSRSHIRDLFGDFELVEPGVVPIQEWHPASPAELIDDSKRMVGFAGVGMKRGTI
jgi:SAM-dependent methyltransferase